MDIQHKHLRKIVAIIIKRKPMSSNVKEAKILLQKKNHCGNCVYVIEPDWKETREYKCRKHPYIDLNGNRGNSVVRKNGICEKWEYNYEYF
jgi:hypothetical protein